MFVRKVVIHNFSTIYFKKPLPQFIGKLGFQSTNFRTVCSEIIFVFKYLIWIKLSRMSTELSSGCVTLLALRIVQATIQNSGTSSSDNDKALKGWADTNSCWYLKACKVFQFIYVDVIYMFNF